MESMRRAIKKLPLASKVTCSGAVPGEESAWFEVTKEQMKDWKGHWENNEKGWWYVNRDGSYPVNNWQQIDSLWYFFDEEGYMKTGWIHWNEKDYFCDESGAMLVNTVTPDGASVGADGAKL